MLTPFFRGATLYLGFIAAQNFVYNEMPTHFDFGPSKHHGILYYIISAPEKGGRGTETALLYYDKSRHWLDERSERSTVN